MIYYAIARLIIHIYHYFMKTYYITGISGFLGRNIVKHLLTEKETKIIGLVFPNESNLQDLEEQGITLVTGNISYLDNVEKFLSTPSEGEKIIIHAAGRISLYKRRDPLTTTINVQGTKNMVDIALKVGCDKFIYISSVDSLNKQKGNDIIVEQDRYDVDKVDGVYSKSKAAANNYVLDAYQNKGLPAIIILPTVFLGPDDPFNSPLNLAIKKYLNGKLNTLVKGQYNIGDVRNIAKGIVLASQKARLGESYILGGTQISVLDFINKVAALENQKPVKNLVPIFLIKLVSPFVEGHAKAHRKKPLFTGFSMDCLRQNSHYSSLKATTELGYQIRSLDETISDTVKWMKESSYLDK